MAAGKLDLFQQYKAEYQAGAKPRLVETGPALYLALSGRGPAGGEAFQAAVGALYSMAFTIKMGRKKTGRGDYAIGKLEAQFWADKGLATAPPRDWSWQLMIRTPAEVAGFPLDEKDLATARAVLRQRDRDAGTEAVKLVTLDEGSCVQMLHVGPYEESGRTLAVMRAFIRDEGRQLTGKHHEIYISDPRRVPPERLKTILRHPVSPAC